MYKVLLINRYLRMNSSLHDIQADIQRLANQQNQIQIVQQQTFMQQQNQPMHYGNQQPYNTQSYIPQGKMTKLFSNQIF